MQMAFNFDDAQAPEPVSNIIQFPQRTVSQRLWGLRMKRSLGEMMAAVNERIELAVSKYKTRAALPMPHQLGTLVFKAAWQRLSHTPPPIPGSNLWLASLPDYTRLAEPSLR